MNDATLPVFASLLLGVVAGPLVWWLGREVLRFVAWHLEYGKAWLPDLAEQEFPCPACAKTFGADEAVCSGCGKSREVAYYASLREVDIAAEQVLRLSRMGALDAETANRMEEGLLRQRGALARLRKPQKSPPAKVELILPGGGKAEGGYIHPETFHESKQPGKHPLRLKPVLVAEEDELPTSGLAIFSRLGGWFLMVAGMGCWLYGFFPLGSRGSQMPGLGELWTGLALFLAGMYGLAFGRASAGLAQIASFGTGILVPAFWMVGPWIHGMEIAPGDWAIGLACAAVGACGGAIIDRYLAQCRGECGSEGESLTHEPTVSEGRLMSLSGLALGLLQLGALAGMARPDGWFAPWGLVIGSAWGLVALCGFQLGRLVLSGMRPEFHLTQWLFESAFGALIALSAGVGASHPIMGISTLSAGMGILAFSVMFFACGPTKSLLGLLKPESDQIAPLVLRAAILGGAGGLACAPAVDPHPWIGVVGAFLGAISLLAFGAVLRLRPFLIVGLGLIALAGGLGAHQAFGEWHLRDGNPSGLTQAWMAINGVLLGISCGAGIARILERMAYPHTTLAGSATLWMRLFSVQALMASAIASLVLAVYHKDLAEVHDWTTPLTAVSWAITFLLVAQVRALRGHGFGLLAISGSVILTGILDNATGRTVIALQVGLLVTGGAGLLLAMGVGRIRPLSRRLSKVSISWAMALIGIHVFGILAIILGNNAGWESLAIPSVVGGATWMMISRNRNLPGLGWVALGWMASGVIPYALRQPSFPEKIQPLLAMALIGLFLWWWIAPARILRRARPVGPVFALLVGVLSVFAAIVAKPFDPVAGVYVGLSVVLLALTPRVWESSRMLGLLGIAFASLCVLFGRNFVEISGRGWLEVCVLTSGIFVVGSALMAHIGRNFSRWTACHFHAVGFVGGFVVIAAGAACCIAPIAVLGEQSRLGLVLLLSTPFAVVLAIASLASLLPNGEGWNGTEKTSILDCPEDDFLKLSAGKFLRSLKYCLGWVAWSEIGVFAYRVGGIDYPIFCLGIFGLLWTFAIGFLDPAGIFGTVFGKTSIRTRKVLSGLSLTGAVLAIAAMVGLDQGKSYLEQISYLLGVISALGLACCLYWRSREMGQIRFGLARLESIRNNRKMQEIHGHGIWMVIFLGGWMLWRVVGAMDETTNPLVWAAGFSVLCAAGFSLLRGGELRWIARPGALQLVGALGLMSVALLVVSVYESLAKNMMTVEEEVVILRAGNYFNLQGSFGEMAMFTGIVLAILCAYFDRVRPENPHPDEAGSDWGMKVGGQTPFAIVFWFSLGIVIIGYACSGSLVGPENAYLLTLGLVPPILGFLAHKSAQPRLQKGNAAKRGYPTTGVGPFVEDSFDMRKAA